MDSTVTVGLFSAVVAVVLVSLIGSVVFWISLSQLTRCMPVLIAVAVGVLLGDAFLHLIPDAMDMAPLQDLALLPGS